MPGVSVGTRYIEMARRGSSASGLTAMVRRYFVSTAFVMRVFVPLKRTFPSRCSAVVFMAEESDPACGSVKARAKGTPPSCKMPRTDSRCSGEPNSRMSRTWRISVAYPRLRPREATLSPMRHIVTMSTGVPPYSSGIPRERKPASCMARLNSTGWRCSRSASATYAGDAYWSRISSRLSSRSCCSSLRLKSILH